jgi:hypothetical protein
VGPTPLIGLGRLVIDRRRLVIDRRAVYQGYYLGEVLIGVIDVGDVDLPWSRRTSPAALRRYQTLA